MISRSPARPKPDGHRANFAFTGLPSPRLRQRAEGKAPLSVPPLMNPALRVGERLAPDKRQGVYTVT